MNYKTKYLLNLILVVCLLATLLGVSPVQAQEPTILTILETSDLHGHIYNWDFFGNQEADQGLAVVSTLVKQERAADPNLLLLDDGDTIQRANRRRRQDCGHSVRI